MKLILILCFVLDFKYDTLISLLNVKLLDSSTWQSPLRADLPVALRAVGVAFRHRLAIFPLLLLAC